jgi:SAM-dependent methyltransferase
VSGGDAGDAGAGSRRESAGARHDAGRPADDQAGHGIGRAAPGRSHGDLAAARGEQRPSGSFGVPREVLQWERRYASAEERLWGDDPSELARLAVARLRAYASRDLTLLDVGCGYGRDTMYLATELGCRALGIDGSPAAIATARSNLLAAVRTQGENAPAVDYLTGDFAEVISEGRHGVPYDIVYCCNLYHLLGPIGRRELAAALAAAARPGGLLYLSTLSPRDAQHYAVGEPVAGEERSWVNGVYLHFCTAEELSRDFAAFEILDLDERSYVEPLANGRVHHHTSWFLEGRRL